MKERSKVSKVGWSYKAVAVARPFLTLSEPWRGKRDFLPNVNGCIYQHFYNPFTHTDDAAWRSRRWRLDPENMAIHRPDATYSNVFALRPVFKQETLQSLSLDNQQERCKTSPCGRDLHPASSLWGMKSDCVSPNLITHRVKPPRSLCLRPAGLTDSRCRLPWPYDKWKALKFPPHRLLISSQHLCRLEFSNHIRWTTPTATQRHGCHHPSLIPVMNVKEKEIHQRRHLLRTGCGASLTDSAPCGAER